MTQLSSDEKNWALFIHLSALVGFVIPFGNVFGPLLMWLLKKNESEFIDSHGKEAVNFQLTMTLLFIGAIILIFILVGIPLLILVVFIDLFFIVIASVKAANGEMYTYPFSLRLVQ